MTYSNLYLFTGIFALIIVMTAIPKLFQLMRTRKPLAQVENHKDASYIQSCLSIAQEASNFKPYIILEVLLLINISMFYLLFPGGLDEILDSKSIFNVALHMLAWGQVSTLLVYSFTINNKLKQFNDNIHNPDTTHQESIFKSLRLELIPSMFVAAVSIVVILIINIGIQITGYNVLALIQ